MQMYTHTHRYRDTHRDMLISEIFFYSICSEYKAHLERIESHLPRLVCERDRDGASSASPTLGLDPAMLSWVPLDINQCHATTAHSKLASSKPGSIPRDARQAWENLVFVLQDFVPCYKSGVAGNDQMELLRRSLRSPTL